MDWEKFLKQSEKLRLDMFFARKRFTEIYFSVNTADPSSTDPVLNRMAKEFKTVVANISEQPSLHETIEEYSHISSTSFEQPCSNSTIELERNQIAVINNEKFKKLHEAFINAMIAFNGGVGFEEFGLEEVQKTLKEIPNYDEYEDLEDLIEAEKLSPEQQQRYSEVVARLNRRNVQYNNKILKFAATGATVAYVALKKSDLDIVITNIDFSHQDKNENDREYYERIKKERLAAAKVICNKLKTNAPYYKSRLHCRRGKNPIISGYINEVDVDINPQSSGLQLNIEIGEFLARNDNYRKFVLGVKHIFKKYQCINTTKELLSSSALVLACVSFLKSRGSRYVSSPSSEIIREFLKFFLDFDYKKNAFTFYGTLSRDECIKFYDTSNQNVNDPSKPSIVLAYDHFAQHNMATSCTSFGLSITKTLCSLLLKTPLLVCF